MKEKKHILIVSQYFYPEQFRINDISNDLISRGYKITVVTGIPNYPQGVFYKGYSYLNKRKEVINGIEIIRLPIIPRGNSSVSLILNYLSFVFSGFFWSLFTKLKPDLVFIYEVSPMTQALPGIWLSKKVKIPVIIYVTDLWPENVEYITGISSRCIIGPIKKMVNYIYKNCHIILTASKKYIENIKHYRLKYGVRVEYWPQYAEEIFDSEKIKLQNFKLIPKDGKFNIIFTGNIGEAQGLRILIKVCLKLKQASIENIRFNIVGDGRARDSLIELILKYDLTEYFNFVSKQPVENIPFLISDCDAAFLSLKADKIFDLTIPAKTQTYLASGKPIIVSANGETTSIIAEASAGFCSPAEDSDALFENIKKVISLPHRDLQLLGNNGKEYYYREFKKSILMEKFEGYLKELI